MNPFAPLVTAALAFAAVVPLPSDPAAVFAIVDRVVLQPDDQQPTRIELHGAFALAEGSRGAFYKSPRTGVLRFQLGSDVEATKRTWRDLNKVAGTGKVVSFGSRYDLLAKDAVPTRVLAVDEPEGKLPAFPVGWGLNEAELQDYGPVRALRLLPRCLPVDLGDARVPAAWPTRDVVFSCANCTAGDDDLRYVFRVETSDGERFASGAIRPGKGITTWTPSIALQVGEVVTWSVQVTGARVAQASIDSASFVVPAKAVASDR